MTIGKGGSHGRNKKKEIDSAAAGRIAQYERPEYFLKVAAAKAEHLWETRNRGFVSTALRYLVQAQP